MISQRAMIWRSQKSRDSARRRTSFEMAWALVRCFRAAFVPGGSSRKEFVDLDLYPRRVDWQDCYPMVR